MLPVTFVVTKPEQLVMAHRAAECGAEVIALKLRDICLVEIIARVQGAVAQKFIHRAVEFVSSRSGDDRYLRARALAVIRAISIADHVEFADRVHSQQLPAGAARGYVDERGPGVLDSVQQKEIVLRAPAGDGVHIADRGVRCAHAARTLGGVADRRRVELDKLVEAAPIEGQFLYLPLIHQSLRLQGRGIDHGRRVHHGDSLLHAADGEGKVQLDILANGQRDAGAVRVGQIHPGKPKRYTRPQRPRVRRRCRHPQ